MLLHSGFDVIIFIPHSDFDSICELWHSLKTDVDKLITIANFSKCHLMLAICFKSYLIQKGIPHCIVNKISHGPFHLWDVAGIRDIEKTAAIVK